MYDTRSGPASSHKCRISLARTPGAAIACQHANQAPAAMFRTNNTKTCFVFVVGTVVFVAVGFFARLCTNPPLVQRRPGGMLHVLGRVAYKKKKKVKNQKSKIKKSEQKTQTNLLPTNRYYSHARARAYIHLFDPTIDSSTCRCNVINFSGTFHDARHRRQAAVYSAGIGCIHD